MTEVSVVPALNNNYSPNISLSLFRTNETSPVHYVTEKSLSTNTYEKTKIEKKPLHFQHSRHPSNRSHYALLYKTASIFASEISNLLAAQLLAYFRRLADLLLLQKNKKNLFQTTGCSLTELGNHYLCIIPIPRSNTPIRSKVRSCSSKPVMVRSNWSSKVLQVNFHGGGNFHWLSLHLPYEMK